MDARLWSIFGHRAETLKQPDVPNLARAIVAYMRRLDITLHAGQTCNVAYVLFQGERNSFQVLVRGDDWSKIVPFLQDGTFDPPSEPLLPWRNGVVNLSNVDIFDPYYYGKVLGVLNGLFPQGFPTSYL